MVNEAQRRVPLKIRLQLPEPLVIAAVAEIDGCVL